MEQKKSRLSVLTNGIIKENPVLVLILGTCPTLAISTSASGGFGMGIAATAVLVFSNIIISLLKDIIPDKVRIPCYIVVIAALVTVVQLLVQAFFNDLYNVLGIYLPLIVVNCIILGRAEMFASKNSVLNSALDGVGMGIGFTIAITCMGIVREFLGGGTFFGMQLHDIPPVAIILLPPGGFFIYGCVIALLNRLTKGKGVKRKSFGCEGCPSAAACGSAQEGGCDA